MNSVNARLYTDRDSQEKNWKDIFYSKFGMEQPSCLKNRFTLLILWIWKKEWCGSHHAGLQVLLGTPKCPNLTLRSKKGCLYKYYVVLTLHSNGVKDWFTGKSPEIWGDKHHRTDYSQESQVLVSTSAMGLMPLNR